MLADFVGSALDVAVIVVEPTPAAVTTPLADTVATPVLDERHVTDAFSRFAGLSVAVSCFAAPSMISWSPPSMATDSTVLVPCALREMYLSVSVSRSPLNPLISLASCVTCAAVRYECEVVTVVLIFAYIASASACSEGISVTMSLILFTSRTPSAMRSRRTDDLDTLSPLFSLG